MIKVVAENKFGDSDLSIPGDGAVIQTVPDAPINIVNEVAITSDNKIGLKWENGLSDGGSPVESYTVFYAKI